VRHYAVKDAVALSDPSERLRPSRIVVPIDYRSACGTSPGRSRCLVSARAAAAGSPPRGAPWCRALRDQTSAQATGVAGVRAALAAALAADRRDRSVWRHTLNPPERGAPMSGTENNHAGTLDERLRLGAGFAGSRPAAHSQGVVRTRAAPVWMGTRPGRPRGVIERHRGPDQKVTLQAWLAGRAHLMATSHQRDLDHALADVRRDMIRQIEDERGRGANLASAGRPVIARLDPRPGFGGALSRDPAWSRLAVPRRASDLQLLAA
jgi:hypothetical protein